MIIGRWMAEDCFQRPSSRPEPLYPSLKYTSRELIRHNTFACRIEPSSVYQIPTQCGTVHRNLDLCGSFLRLRQLFSLDGRTGGGGACT